MIEIVSNQGVIDLTPMLGATPTAVDLEAEVALAAAARDGALAAKADAELAQADAEAAQAAAEAAAAQATEISGIDTLDEGNAALIDNETSLTRQRLSELIGTGAKRGADWLAKVTAPPTGDSLPVVTVATTSQTTGTLVAPKRVGNVSGAALDIDNDPAFRYDGGPGGDSVNADFVGPQAWTLGTWSLHPEFTTGRVADVELRLRATAAALNFRIEVDGAPVTAGMDKRTGASITAGSEQWVRLTFPTAAVRTIKVWLSSTTFGGVKVPTGTVTRPGSFSRRLGINGDSLFAGALDSLRSETAAYFLYKMLECDSLINVSRSGTGWCEDSSPNNPFVERLPALLAMQPHIFLGPGSRNDFDHTTDEVYAASRDALALVTSVPVPFAAGPAQSSFAAQNTGVRDGARAAGVPFLDILGVITGATTGSDGIHPTPQGHRDMAVALNDKIDRAALDARVAAAQGVLVTVALTTSANPVSQGTNVTLTATTTPPAAGQVQFRDSGSLVGTATVNPTTGVATLVTSTLPTGARSIVAEYRPSSPRFSRATSAALNLVVAPPALSDIIMTNLLAEITAEALSLSDGAAVSSLTPPRGSRMEPLVQATGTLQPAFVASASHGKKALRFQADRLDAPDWAAATAPGTPLTIYSVHRMVTLGSGTQYVFRGSSTGTQVSYQHSSSAGAYTATTSASGSPAPQQHQADLGWQVTAITYDSGTVTVRQNNITAPGTVGLSTTSMTLDGLGLGSFGGGTSGYDLYISAVYAYSGKHTNDEVTQMMLYLSSHWNVPLDAVS